MTAYSLEAVPTVERFMSSDMRHRLLMGPIGSGKSVGCIMDITQRAAKQEPNEHGVRKTRWAVVRNTNRQLEDTTIQTWMDWFPAGQWGNWRQTDKNYDMKWKLEDGTVVECEIRFRALDRPDQVNNLLSAEYTGAWFNEGKFIPYEVYDTMDGRIGRFPAQKDGGCTWMGMLIDTNPPDEDNWIYELFEEIRPDNAEAFYQPSGLSDEAENIINLPPDYYLNIIKTKDSYYIHVYVKGNYGYIRDGHPVYDEFVDDTHCVGNLEPVANLPLYIGLDFGLTPACVICQKVNGRLLVLDEVTSTRAGIKQFLDAVKPYLSEAYPNNLVEQWYCDPAGGQSAQTDMETPIDIMIKEGIWPIEGQQNPEIRIESVKQLLNRMVDGKPALVISPKCKLLRKGFNGKYRFRRLMTSIERYADKPDKNDVSHIHDALQYLTTRLFGIYVEEKPKEVRVVGGFSQ